MVAASKAEFETHVQKSAHRNAVQNERSMMRLSMQFPTNPATVQPAAGNTTVKLLSSHLIAQSFTRWISFFSSEFRCTKRKWASNNSCAKSRNRTRKSTKPQSGRSYESMCEKGECRQCSTTKKTRCSSCKSAVCHKKWKNRESKDYSKSIQGPDLLNCHFICENKTIK